MVQPMGQALLRHECRYSELPSSEDESGTKLSPAQDVRCKAVLAADEVCESTALVGSFRVTLASCAYVLAAHRDFSANLEAFAESVTEPPAARFVKATAIWQQFTALPMAVVVMDRQAAGPLWAYLSATGGLCDGLRAAPLTK